MNRANWIGQTLGGRYRIDEILGQGGMSAVYKAYDPNLKRVVAIKLIHPHLSTDPRFLSRFEEEATAVAQLRHPNIVQVYDFNHDEELYYMVQEFLPGETLQDRLRRLNKSARRMPLADAIRYTTNICDATGYAHKRGMIHRDIKPANIMLDVQDQAILMDFGIVKILGGEKHTATGAVVGTALYIPPEVIRGESPDVRSDLYSLAITLYEMVSGRPPFEADSAMTLMMMHLNDPLPNLSSFRPDIPGSLIEVIEKALAKNPGQRYASMSEFAAALKACDLGVVQPANQATLADQTPLPIHPDSTSPANYSDKIAAAAIGAAKIGTAIDGTIVDGTEPSGTPPTVAASPRKGKDDTPLTPTISELRPDPSAVAGTAAVASQPPVPAKPPARNMVWIALGAVVILVVLIGIFFAFSNRDQNGDKQVQTTSTEESAAIAILPESTSTNSPTGTAEALLPIETATITPTESPTAIPSPSVTPTPTIPVGVPYVVIRAITLDNQSRYVVDYETFEYTEKLPGQHVHFFFDTVPADQAGTPGKGPWTVYGGPRPFTKYRPSQRPPAAAQMCALVANPDHSVRLESGNCFILPDVNVAAPFEATACLSGPNPAFPPVVQLEAGQVLLVNGLSPDETWWNVVSPENPNENCWIERARSSFQGDMSTISLVEPPASPPDAAAAGKLVTITNITLDALGNYVIEYQIQGFEEKLPGTHIHFFFDTFSADQVGPTGGGNRLMYGGPSPFTGFNQAAKPVDATGLCALVANPDHTVIPDSGNCFTLP